MGAEASSLRVHGGLRQVFRHWDVRDVYIVKKKYQLLTLRYCVTIQQLANVLGRQLPDPLVSLCFSIFAPTRVRAMPSVPVVDMMEVFVCLILLCQATMNQRIAFLFDMLDAQNSGRLSSSDLFLLFQAAARSIVKMTNTSSAVLVDKTIQAFVERGMAVDQKRKDSVDKLTFCSWITSNVAILKILKACTGEDNPKLYIAIEKDPVCIGYIEFDFDHELHSISLERLRGLIKTELASPPCDYVFLNHGRQIPRAKESDVKAWDIIPFAIRGTPGHLWHQNTMEYEYKDKLEPRDMTSKPHPNQQQPYCTFQFYHHHHTIRSFTKKINLIAPLYKHLQFRLKGSRTLWRLCESWCGEWIINQAEMEHPSRVHVVHKLRKHKKKSLQGLIVKDTQGRILSQNPVFSSIQAKLRLLAMETQLQSDAVSPSTILVERHVHPSRYYSRIIGTRSTTPTTGEWHVVEGNAQLTPSSLYKVLSSMELQPDQVQVFPVIWMRPTQPHTVSPLLDIPMNRTECLLDLFKAMLPTLSDKRLLNHQDCMGRTLLHYAALFGHSRFIDVLLLERVLVDVFDCQRNTPLHLAASRGRLKAVTLLLAHEASTSALNMHGQLPLHLALYHVEKKYDISTGIFSRYSKGEQVVDLLWDRTSSALWHLPDAYGHTVHELESEIFGSIFDAARAGLVPRIHHLIEMKKVPHLNVQMEILRTSALIEAAERGRHNVVDYLVRQGADVFRQNLRGATALHKAAARGFERITECLLHRYPTLASVQDINGKTALHVAIEQKNTSVALLICEYMIQDEHLIKDIMGSTPLHIACLLGNIAVARVLLVKGSDPLATASQLYPKSSKHFLGVYLKRPCSDYILTPLECVLHGWSVAQKEEANHAFYELFVALIEAAKPSPKHPVIAHLGHTICVKLSNVPAMAVQCLEFLSQHKLLVVEALDSAGNTVLMKEVLQRAPAAENCLAVVQSLIQFGANVQLTNHNNENALMCAAFYGNDKLLELLLDTVPHEILLASCQNANSPLHMACIQGHLSTIQLLLSRGASLHTCTKDESPLYYCIRSQKIEVLEFLLHHGAQVNISAEIKQKRVYFDTQFKIAQTALGSPMTLLLLLTKSHYQERGTDHSIPSHIADRIASMQYIYMNKKEQVARNMWLNLHRMADLLIDKLVQIDAATKVHMTREDIVLAARVGFWSIISTYLTHRRMDLSSIVSHLQCIDKCLDSSIPEAKMDAIHLAAAAGQPVVVSLLVANGADPNAKMIHGRNTFVSPLFFAYSRGHHITAAKLHLLGATMTTTLKNEKINYLMHSHLNWWMKLAILWQWLKPYELINLGAYVNMLHQLQLSSANNSSMVHTACHRGSLPLLMVYHQAGFTFQDVSTSGHTPLTIAIQQQQSHIVEWLMRTIPSLITMRSPRLPVASAAALPKISLVKERLLLLLLDRVLNESAEERVQRLTAVDAGGYSALEYAALASDENAIVHLLKEIPESSVTIATIVAALQGEDPHSVLDLLLKSWKGLRDANFDYILQLFIMASSNQAWQVVNHLLTQEEAGVEPFITWIRRAASCCLVLHRAAAVNQVAVVKSLVTKFSIPPDLIVANIPSRTPLWYAAAHTAWDSFVVLLIALGATCSILPSLVQRGTKDTVAHGRCRAFKFTHERLHKRSSMLNGFFWPIVAKDNTDALRLPGFEICTWKNFSAFSIFGSPTLHTQRLIHRVAQYWMAHTLIYPVNEPNDSLLHLAVRARDTKMVELLVRAGAPIYCVNHAGELPWLAAARQNDSSSTSIVAFVWPLLELPAKEAVVKAATLSDTLNMATLTYLLTQAIPKEAPTTLLNLPGHSYFSSAIKTNNVATVRLLLEVKAPMDHRVIWQELFDSAAKNSQQARVLVEILMPHLPLSVPLEIVANLVLLGAQKQWYNVVLHLLQAFQLPLVRQLQSTLAAGTNASLLHFAVDHGQATVLQRLLQQEIAISRDSKGQTPLHKLAYRGDIGLMQLWQRVAQSVWLTQLDIQDNNGDTAFHIAARRGHLAVVEVLQLSNSRASAIQNVKGWTPILEAAKHNHLPIVMRLFLQQPISDTLVSIENISIVTIAAEYGAFAIVTWLLATMGSSSSDIQHFISKDGKNLVHFAALYNAIELLSSTPALKSLINSRDHNGCLPLHYALMLGHLKVVEFLIWNGSDIHSPIQNHVVEKPVTLSTLISWNPLPGWFGHAMHSNESATILSNEKLVQRVPYTLNQWDITKTSLLESSSRLGLISTVTLVLILLPQLPQLCDGALETRQRIFMQAVSLNHVDIVDRLCLCEVVHPVDKSHYFRDFIEVAIQKSSSRGLEQMTLCLLNHWRNSCYLGTVSAALVTQAEFAFQFATVLQQACIYGRLQLVEYLLQQGGESIIGYRVDEGPALVYAFAFGHRDVVALLCRYGAEISALDGHFAPSLKLWIEFKEHPLLQNEWYERGSEPKHKKIHRRPFAGPIQVYPSDEERLPKEYLEMAFRSG